MMAQEENKSPWERYIDWYKSKFGVVPNGRTIINIRKHNIEARYHILVIAVFKRITKDSDVYFEKYLEYVFHQWIDAKMAINMFPKWIGSPVMIRDFLDNCKIVTRRESDTYSSHSSVGRGEDGEFDPTSMF